MEKKKYMIMMEIQYMKGNIQKGKKMDMEKVLKGIVREKKNLNLLDYILKENI